ncbi:hypothetical protein [Desulfoferrobacter suflitae]|uniref:hypothetical protein n=1 Tax=Desulfoferrobacter suflitae TaxID=2865782 RepID=UPI0021644720|nr:hypothetical protein [Desulfoferrobacter suflitae]MCK8603182.1 hypothetical protein [Desulfoferrobacter suflitae]
MIDFELFPKIKAYHEQEGLKPTQIARELGPDPRTVEKWLQEKRFRPRKSYARRTSKLDPFKHSIIRMLETHSYSAVQIMQRIREEGFDDSKSRIQVNVIRSTRSVGAFNV